MAIADDVNTEATGAHASNTDPEAETAPAGEAVAMGDRALGVGSTVGRYRLLEPLGVGGMGMVYRARDPALDRDLAIKVVKPRVGGADAQARLLREAQAMARLRHPNVVPVFDVGTVGTAVFVVMPHLQGGTLSRWLRDAKRSWSDVLVRFVAAGRGLAVAHAAGLVHRDFKPENVLLGVDGEVQVADFGLARLGPEVRAPSLPTTAAIRSSDLTRTGDLLGTPSYMAPEQLRGDTVDARADIFSFCVALFEGLYGTRPFVVDVKSAAGLVTLIDAIEASVICEPADRDVPGWLRATIVRGLRPRPEERWPSMRALLDHIQARTRRTRRWVVGGGAAVAAIAIVAGFVATRGHALRPRTYHSKHLTSTGDVSVAALAPDRRHLATISNSELVLIDLDGTSAPRLLASDARRDGGLAWAADGNTLAYWRGPTVVSVDLLTGAIHPIDIHSSMIFTGAAEVTSWDAGDKKLVRTALTAPNAATSCRVSGDYNWMEQLVATSTGDVLVAVSTGNIDDPVDRLIRSDRPCARSDLIASGLALKSIAPLASDDRLVGLSDRSDGKTDLVLIDRDGHVRRDLAPAGAMKVAGLGVDGSVVFLDSSESWQLFRASTDGRISELDSGTGNVRVAIDPDGKRLAVIDIGDHRALRIVDLDHPRIHGAPIDHEVAAVEWSADGHRLALLAQRGSASEIVIENVDGSHRVESAVVNIAPTEVHWIDSDAVAVQRDDARTYVAIDLESGATHDLFDPTIGWVSELRHAPHDVRLLIYWSQPAGTGLWLVEPNHTPELILPIATSEISEWSSDGRGILLHEQDSDSALIERLDLESRRREPYVRLAPDAHGHISQVVSLPGGDVLVVWIHSISDVVVATPDR